MTVNITALTSMAYSKAERAAVALQAERKNIYRNDRFPLSVCSPLYWIPLYNAIRKDTGKCCANKVMQDIPETQSSSGREVQTP